MVEKWLICRKKNLLPWSRRKLTSHWHFLCSRTGVRLPLYHNDKRYHLRHIIHSRSNKRAYHSFLFIGKAMSTLAQPCLAPWADAATWDRLKEDRFRSYLGETVDLNGKGTRKTKRFFIWCDKDANGKAEPGEVNFYKGCEWWSYHYARSFF